MRKLSIVVPVLNERENLPLLLARLTAINWDALELRWEVIFVDDGSTDGSSEWMQEQGERREEVKWIRLSRNFGSHLSLIAGLEHADGDAVTMLAADLQDPPETIPELVAKWKNGAMVVWAARAHREQQGLLDRAFSSLYYVLMRRFVSPSMPRTGADFALLDRKVVQAVRSGQESHISLFALIHWLGFSQETIFYTKAARQFGHSKWNFGRKLKLVIDSFVGFSYFPIQMASILGLLLSLSGFAFTAFQVFRWFFRKEAIEGWTSLVSIVLITGGVQLVMLGVIGEYLWRTLESARRRPRYVVESSHLSNS